MDESEKHRTICFCHNVSLGKIEEAILAGANTLSAIQAETLASTGCGGCECDVIELLQQTLSEANNQVKDSPIYKPG